MSTRGLAAAVRRFLPEVRRQRWYCPYSATQRGWPRSRIAWRKRVAREVAAVYPVAPGLAVSSKKRLAEITARLAQGAPRGSSTCLSEMSFTAATQFYAFPRAPTGPDCVTHEQPRAPAHRDQASDPERRRLPRPSQRAPPHHLRLL